MQWCAVQCNQLYLAFFFFKQKTAYEMLRSLVGSGLGLNIVSDLAEAYRGSFIMGRAELGGLAASLSLPKVARVES